jgi:hypothetical protein
MDGQSKLEQDQPRSATGLLELTFALYRRYTLLFPTLAAGVVVPYALLMLLATGEGPLQAANHGAAAQLLPILDVILVGPLISALHVHAVRDIAAGEEPRLGDVARRGLVCLPVVCAAVVISFLGIVAGLVALIVPGVLLMLRWSVVAQTAALEGGGWQDALRRSADLTHKNYLHILALQVLVGIFSTIVWTPIFLHFKHADTTALTFLLGTGLRILLSSFGALATAVLYFDLKARVGVEAAGPAPAAHRLDPRSYSDQDRPPGWYVDPSSPKLMRYWVGDRERAWSQRTTGTPNQTLHEWEMLRECGDESEPKSISGRVVEPIGHPLDPASYSDEDRPAGWYVDPDSPWRMRYWAADGTPAWGKRKAKTPKQVLAGWRDLRWTR